MPGPPPKIQDQTFLGWVEEFFNLKDVPQRTFAVYYRDLTRTYFLLRVRSPGKAPGSEVAFINAFTEGDESFRDLKGINVAINYQDFLKNPVKTLKSIGEGTWKDLTSVDEVSQDRRGENVEKLVQGKTNINGHFIGDPEHWTLKTGRSIGLPLTDASTIIGTNARGQRYSKVRLLGTDDPHAHEDELEDRQVVEENKGRDKKYKPYQLLAGALTGLAGYSDATPVRTAYYDEALDGYNRTIVSELGINLDDVLPLTVKKNNLGQIISVTGGTNGSFKDELLHSAASFTTVKANLEDLLGNEDRIARALSLPIDQWRALQPGSKEFLKDYLLSEFFSQDFYAGPEGKAKTPGADMRFSASGKWMLDEELEEEGGFNEWLSKQQVAGDPSNYRTGVIQRADNQSSIRAQMQARLRSPELIADIYESARRRRVEDLVPAMAASSGIPFTSINDPLMPQLIRDSINAQSNTFAAKAIDRYKSATKSIEMANNLFFASSTKEILESIENGKFIEAAILNTRFLNLLPFLNPKTGTPMEYMQTTNIAIQMADKLLPVSKTLINIRNKFGGMSGLVFEENKIPDGLAGITSAFGLNNAEVWVTWSKKVGNETKWTRAAISPQIAQGLFKFTDPKDDSEYGVFELLNNVWSHNGKLLGDVGFANPELYNPQKLFENGTSLMDFLNNLNAAASNVAGGAAPSNEFERLAQALGLGDRDTLNKFLVNYNKFIDPDTGAYDLIFNKLASGQFGSFALDPAQRWEFVTKILKEGKVAQFQKLYVGLLNRYARAANALRGFLYQEILRGGYAGNNALIRAAVYITTPIRSLLKSAGFGDEFLVSEAVSQWRIVQYFTGLSNKLYALSQSGGALTGLAKLLGPKMLSNLGSLASGASGILTGGISYLLAAFGDVAWAMGKRLLRLEFTAAFRDAEEILKRKTKTVMKIVGMLLITGCAVIIIPFMALIIPITGFFGLLSGPTGGGSFAEISSSKVRVVKTERLQGNSIIYNIQIRNITGETDAASAEEITIASFEDNLVYIPPCGPTGTPTSPISVGSDPSYGTGDIPTLESLPKLTLAPGETIEIPFELRNIRLTDGTYSNTVEVSVQGEDDKVAATSASTRIGDGGCIQCPAGWPVERFIVTQGPDTPGAVGGEQTSHRGVEAVDMAGNMNIPVRATHNGIATATTQRCSDSVCGYGNYVMITSPQGFSTIYAHLSGFAVSTGEDIEAGTIIGYLGSTGNSTGPHVHYEFPDTSHQCVPGRNLRLENVGDANYPGSYVPETVNRSCYGAIVCNQSQ